MSRLLALLRALTCADGHRWQRDAWWDPFARSWMATDWTCVVCRLVAE